MDRRAFCRGTIATSVMAAYPMLAACGRTEPEVEIAVAKDAMRAISLDGHDTELAKYVITALSESLDGALLTETHMGYDEARKLWNGMHDRRPTLIAQCASVDDVQRAVTFARENELLTAVRGGGHSWPGKSSCDGGMVIDLSAMNRVSVDAFASRAKAGGGALLNALDRQALEHGMVTTAGVVSHTGVGGFTLGGGFGRLNRKFGLAVDNLTGAEIVTADGKVRWVSEYSEPDLFWAIRGGGGNFGVVTEFEFALHPFERNVLSGNMIYSMKDAKAILDTHAEMAASMSDDLYVAPGMVTSADGEPLLMMEVLYAGDPKAGERELAPLLNVATPIQSNFGVNDYLAMQRQDDALTAHGIRSYAKSGMVADFTPELVDALLEAHRPDMRAFMGTHTSGGAVNRVDELATAFPHRNSATMLVFVALWPDPADDKHCVDMARAWYSDLEAFIGTHYDNIDFDDRDGHTGNYGPAYDRLSRVKGRYDPGNQFRLNSNIKPLIST